MTPEFIGTMFVTGVIYAGLASLFGLGIGLAIDLIKLFGGVR